MRYSIPLVVALSSAGCSPAYTVMTASDVNSPLTMGPVTRIGGGSGGREKTVASVQGEANDFVAATRSEQRIGNTVIVKHETTRVSSNSDAFCARVMSRTENKFERETRIDAVDTGAYAFISSGAAVADKWVEVKGRVVEVDHVR
jgi:hypothetical protein